MAAIFAFAATDSNYAVIMLAYFPALFFWALDAFYLWQETLFRGLYDVVRITEPDNIDFSMSTENIKDCSWNKAVFSPSLVLFYGSIFLTPIVFFLIVYLVANSN